MQIGKTAMENRMEVPQRRKIELPYDPTVSLLDTYLVVVAIQSLSHVWPFATPWTAGHQASLPFTTSQSLLKLMAAESVMPSNRLILYYPLLLLPSIFSSIRVFSNKSSLPIRWPKYWSLSFNIHPSKEITQDWSPLGWTGWTSLQSKGLSSILQHHSSKASVLQHSAFFTVQLSHPYMTTGKTIALTRRTFVG